MTESGTSLKDVAAAAADVDLFVVGMNAGFHGYWRAAPLEKWARSVALLGTCRNKSLCPSAAKRNCACSMKARTESGHFDCLALSTKFVDNSVDVADGATDNPRWNRRIVKLLKFYTRYLANNNQ